MSQQRHAQPVEEKYRTLVELGRGGTAIVYLGVQHGPGGFNKLVVLKKMKPNAMEQGEGRQLFLREARLAARLNHRNIVQTNEIYEDDGLPVIAMEHLQGQALSHIVGRNRRKTFTLEMHLRVLAEALVGLDHAHNLADFNGSPLGLVHRDVSPHNIFLTYDGQVKVLDFGIAKLNNFGPDTQAGIIKGKPRYMAPEQIEGKRLDRRADIYACGVMLWEAVTGMRMWQNVEGIAVLTRVLSGEVTRPTALRPGIPQFLEDLIMRALSLDPEKRQPSAEALEAEIEDALGRMGSTVRCRDVGRLASELFADVRSETSSVIENQLSKVASMSFGEYRSTNAPTLVFARNEDQVAEAQGASGVRPRESISATYRAGSGQWTRMWPLFLLLPAALFGGLLWYWQGQMQTAPRETVAGSAPSAGKVTAEAVGVALRVAVTPPSARLFVDGEHVAGHPILQTFPVGGSRHEVRAEADGYVPQSRWVTLNGDMNVNITLKTLPVGVEPPDLDDVAGQAPAAAGHTASRTPRKPTPRKHRTEGAHTSRKRSARKTRSAPPRPAANCDPPYYFTADGLKKFKRECM